MPKNAGRKTTHWTLATGIDVEIFNAIDDHSRFLVGSDALVVFRRPMWWVIPRA
jgi:hypothetical protein